MTSTIPTNIPATTMAPVAWSPSPDGLTVFQTKGERAAKLIARDGKVLPAEHAMHYRQALEVRPGSFDSLVTMLTALQTRPDAHLVRGGLVGGSGQVENLRRLLYGKAGGAAATVYDVPRTWLPLDMDDVPLPDGVDWQDLAACADVAIALLPSCFHGREAICGATGSHGIKPGARLRLWFPPLAANDVPGVKNLARSPSRCRYHRRSAAVSRTSDLHCGSGPRGWRSGSTGHPARTHPRSAGICVAGAGAGRSGGCSTRHRRTGDCGHPCRSAG